MLAWIAHTYEMTSDRFQGRFGNSNNRFYLRKIADYYDWTIYMDYYFYYPNNNWYWTPFYSRGTKDVDSSIVVKHTDAQNGIVNFGKRM